MGIFFPDEPDYFPDQRPVGFKRYAQVLERDWKRFFLVDLLTLGSLIPFGLGMGYAVLSSSVLVLIPVCILGGLIAGPGLAGMYDMLLRGLRDNVDDWWFSYKKAMRQNWKASLVPGVVMCLFLGFLIFACAMLWWSTAPITFGTVAVLTASTLILTMVFSVWWPWSAFLVPFLGVWYILYLSNFLLYEQLDQAFRIEEQIGEAFPEQVPDYGDVS